jgi:hypothetical protein
MAGEAAKELSPGQRKVNYRRLMRVVAPLLTLGVSGVVFFLVASQIVAVGKHSSLTSFASSAQSVVNILQRFLSTQAAVLDLAARSLEVRQPSTRRLLALTVASAGCSSVLERHHFPE